LISSIAILTSIATEELFPDTEELCSSREDPESICSTGCVSESPAELEELEEELFLETRFLKAVTLTAAILRCYK
jgi:hypothetical protein